MFWIFMIVVIIMFYTNENHGLRGIIYGKEGYKESTQISGEERTILKFEIKEELLAELNKESEVIKNKEEEFNKQ